MTLTGVSTKCTLSKSAWEDNHWTGMFGMGGRGVPSGLHGGRQGSTWPMNGGSTWPMNGGRQCSTSGEVVGRRAAVPLSSGRAVLAISSAVVAQGPVAVAAAAVVVRIVVAIPSATAGKPSPPPYLPALMKSAASTTRIGRSRLSSWNRFTVKSSFPATVRRIVNVTALISVEVNQQQARSTS